MITKHERLRAAIAGEVADRPPIALWRHFPVDDQDPTRLADATLAFQQTYDFDFVKVTPSSSYCIRDWGVHDVWNGRSEGTRDYFGRVVDNPVDWRELEILKPTEGSLGGMLHCLTKLSEALSDETPFIQTIFSPLAQAKNLAGEDRMLSHLRQFPDDVLFGLNTITETTLSFIEEIKKRNVSGIFYALQHASYRYFDPEAYARYGEPFDRKILEAGGDLWLNVLHLHGEDVMFDLASSYGTQVVNWHDRESGPSLPEGKAKVAGAVCGGLRRWDTLILGDPNSIREEALDAFKSLENGKGLILGTGCVVPVLAPHGNLTAARQVFD
ncbi:MAG: uroporphyrinogen decarboxylase [Anaerolineales bacterium]|nr:uroporphyrinogen decarboxylase [Anaerolineales bacterium]